MVIFISGSINAGKTTTAKALAEKLDMRWIDIDDLRVPNVELARKYSKKIAVVVEEINRLTAEGESVVVSYVIRPEDHDQIVENLTDQHPFFVTLSPSLEIALSKRGERILTDWELQRIRYLYKTGIANPTFGEIIDNSDLTVDEVVAAIEGLLRPDGRIGKIEAAVTAGV